MSFDFNTINKQSFAHQDFKVDLSKTHPISKIADNMFFEIFSHLNLSSLAAVCLTNKAWKNLADSNNENGWPLWHNAIYKELTVGSEVWSQFGKDVVKEEDREKFSSITKKHLIAFKKFKCAFPEKRVKDELMLVWIPKTLNGELNPKNLNNLIKKMGEEDKVGINFFNENLINETIDQSHWLLTMKQVPKQSINKTYIQQKEFIKDIAKKTGIEFKVPEILEVTVCMVAKWLSNKRETHFSYSSTCKSRLTRNEKRKLNDFLDQQPDDLERERKKLKEIRYDVAGHFNRYDSEPESINITIMEQMSGESPFGIVPVWRC